VGLWGIRLNENKEKAVSSAWIGPAFLSILPVHPLHDSEAYFLSYLSLSNSFSPLPLACG
jgi:hypothetical protein